MKRKYHAVRVGGKLGAYGPHAKWLSYYKRHHWGGKDGVIVISDDRSLYDEAIADGANNLTGTVAKTAA